MRSLLTLLLMLATVAFWGISVWVLHTYVNPPLWYGLLATPAVALLVLFGFLISKRIFGSLQAYRRRFTVTLAITWLLTVLIVAVDKFLVNGDILTPLLDFFGLANFLDERAALTIALSASLIQPILYIISSFVLLLLPQPREYFSRSWGDF